MPENTPPNLKDAGHEVRTYFVRNRNALVARGMFSELYVDYFLHAGEQKLRVEPAHAELFKRALAGFALHLASRPWNEMTAWTIHFQQPLLNLFLTGDNETGAITGRVFDEDVKEMQGNLFYADTVRPGEPKRRSAVEFEGGDPLAGVEKFYAQSEQRPARFFQLAEEDYVMVAEHPDCDKAWFDALTTDAMRGIDKSETLALLEKRIYRWHCGCNQSRMMEVLLPAMKRDPGGLFGDEPKIEMRCPRCGARHIITREAMEAFAPGKK
ncbi:MULTISPECIES: Hsp33 family molecular chaperone HslO [unclassified Ereboglobus]|uniref:Hsp33 family molecular chaperone HslO n=1 Tax=unclassified Ereboglobus TaxID=2626932 RepID=UPI002405A0B7|nr:MULTISPECIES: Hsp33 family molecular chaperone HslO [unclassified Ereboglobus]